MRFYTPTQLYRLARLAIKKRINRDPEGRHCPDCYRKGSCADEACLCHRPLGVNARENVGVTARFGG